MDCSTGTSSCKKLGLFCTEACKYSEDKCANRHEINDLEFNDENVYDDLDENH